MTTASIIIPVFNRAHLVHRAIDSALAQTLPCEVLLVDHGSTDAIGELVRKYAGRIRYVRRERDQGAIVCWRDGLEQATGGFVHITYDDDWISPQFMERCVSAMRDDVAFAYTRAELHWEPRGRVEPTVLHPPGLRPIKEVVQYLLRARFSLSPGCAVLRRSDALKNLLTEVPGGRGQYGKNSGVGEDLLLFLLTSLSYPRYVHLAEPLAHFLAHDGSITIGAIRGGRGDALAEAYERAKQYYLSQPGALPRDGRLRRMQREARWLVESRALGAYALKGLRRLG